MHCRECSVGTRGLVGYGKVEGERDGESLTENRKREMKQNKKCLFCVRQNRTKDEIRKNMFLLCYFLGKMITYYNYYNYEENIGQLS